MVGTLSEESSVLGLASYGQGMAESLIKVSACVIPARSLLGCCSFCGRGVCGIELIV